MYELIIMNDNALVINQQNIRLIIDLHPKHIKYFLNKTFYGEYH